LTALHQKKHVSIVVGVLAIDIDLHVEGIYQIEPLRNIGVLLPKHVKSMLQRMIE
jgi:hypothetical protein